MLTAGAGECADDVSRDIPFRARPTDALYAAVAEHYDLVPVGPVTDLGGGHLNLHIPDPPGPGWVLRVYARWVSPERVAFVQKLRTCLRSAGIPVPSGRLTLEGAGFIEMAGRVAEVDEYVAGLPMDRQRLTTGMAMLGRVHNALDGLVDLRGPEADYPNHIAAAQALSLAERTRALVAAWPEPTKEEARICQDMVGLAERLHRLEADFGASWHSQHVHGDFWDNNVLFDASGHITAVLDLDFAGWRPRTDDVALVLYYATATPGRDRVSADHLHWLKACVDAYDSALDAPLSHEERISIPLATARTVLFMTRNILGLEHNPSGYGAPALPAQRAMLAGMAEELVWCRDLVEHAGQVQEIFSR